MICSCPVIGNASGGLLETVRTDKVAGFLAQPPGEPSEWSEYMGILAGKNEMDRIRMGRDCRKRGEEFSEKIVGDRVNEIVQSLVQ